MDRFKKLIKSLRWGLYCSTLLALGLSMYTLGCGGGVIQRIDEQANVPPPAPSNKGFLELPQGPKNTRIYLNDRYNWSLLRLSPYYDLTSQRFT